MPYPRSWNSAQAEQERDFSRSQQASTNRSCRPDEDALDANRVAAEGPYRDAPQAHERPLSRRRTPQTREERPATGDGARCAEGAEQPLDGVPLLDVVVGAQAGCLGDQL